MAYEVTATKKRPQTFDELAGQEFVVTTLKNSIKTGRIAHAYLFSGPRGIGKTSAARILAKALNCDKGPTDIPCGKCPNCEEISKGNSLDVIEIDGASNTSVNDVREIKDEVLFAPNSCRYKIYIIDEVHMLSNSAFNALLKTIEEPPPYIIFIFATTEIHKVPATIRSRCQQYNFRLISVETIKSLLAKVSAELGIKSEKEALFWIAKEATGSVRDAYTLFDQVASFCEGEISLEKIQEKMGFAGLDLINNLAECMAEGDAKKVLELADTVLSRGISVEQLIIDLTEYFRNVLFIKHGIHNESLFGSTLDRFSKNVVGQFSVLQIEQAIELLLRIYRNIRFSLNQRFELELLLSRLANLKVYIDSREILEKIMSLRAEISGEKSCQDGVGVEEEQTGESTPKDLVNVQNEIIAAVKKKKLAVSSALEKAINWDFQPKDVYLTFDNTYSANCVRQDLQFVIQKVEEITGKKFNIHIKIDNQSVQDEKDSEDAQVEMVKRVFKGQVVKGE
ncbi:MAG: DNA polymerase III subunit gamma/tau [Spirochaetota bacterium]